MNKHDPRFVSPDEVPDDEASYKPPGEPAKTRNMRLEWFNEAADIALSDGGTQLIEDVLDEGALSVIYGESNAGKTFVALDMAHAVATGREWNGKKTRRGLVVFVAAEGGKRITRRIAALRSRHKGEKPLFALIRYPIDLRSSDANTKELLAIIREAERQCGELCVWVIIDTLSRAMAGGDENSPVDMGRIVVAADFIRAETGAHFTYVHHTGKDAARGARGHSLLRAATDTEIEATPNCLKVTKQRDMESGDQYAFALVDIVLGEEVSGKMIKSAVVEWADAPTLISAERSKSCPRSERLLVEIIGLEISEAGFAFQPVEYGRTVQAATDAAVRERYYARVAEVPKPNDTPKKLADRQRQAFNTAIKKMLNAKMIEAGTLNGDRVLWFP